MHLPPFVAQAPLPTIPPESAMDSWAGVSVVVPVYNEQDAVVPVLTELLEVLDRELAGQIAYELIVVDDGSTDRTPEALATLPAERVRAFRHPKNRGYGAALKTGIARARQPWILITDADGTYPNAQIPELLKHRSDYEMVVGSRAGSSAHEPFLRRLAKGMLRRLASYLSRTEIPDLNSGFRVFRKDLARAFQRVLPDRFSYTTTITLALFSAGYQVKYVPIEYRKRTGRSKIRPIADTVEFSKLIVRTILYFDPLRVVLPVAGLFMLAALVVGLVSAFVFNRLMDVTTLVLFVTGFQLLALGMLADMLNRRLP
jgi:glycosyltransferase involved in cell wall biosynthesis